ncbi:hypothetical protein [Microbulbifer celer]|uniref:Uncharacterized protein n=1 Tax=Microbulbifer celer TaxID=435905 RepID=A0ABW3U7R0_9GAMM|nr:hypothetical protein [Microbulbifer celer]UFN58595.1 hypothetical protein LPW13_06000 [Microbulbifer celer]
MEGVIKSTILDLVKKMDSLERSRVQVIPWSTPVPSFGDPVKSYVATLGLNPSNKEFVDDAGLELNGKDRRFETLKSLGVKNWSDVKGSHLSRIEISCRKYFEKNPYDRWFGALDELISGTGFSYYNEMSPACHLDLVPFATDCKWSSLNSAEKKILLESSIGSLANLLKISKIKLIVLNGATVVNQFNKVTQANFSIREKASWCLPRSNGAHVKGVSYVGSIDHVNGVELGRSIKVVGFNHNIQSSFGVTKKVKSSIKKWISSYS